MKKFKNVLALTTLSVLLFSCGGDKNKQTTVPAQTPTETTANQSKGFEIVLTADDAMQFDKKEIKVPVGETITLTLKHTGKMDKAVMGHNWVLLNQGTDMAAFANAAAMATQTDYIPEAKKSEVLAHTKVLGGGQVDKITFTVDQAGTYDFLCSFPAHFALMQGKLIAE